MLLRTARLDLHSLTAQEWSAVADGRWVRRAPDYPTEGDLVVAALMVSGDWPNDDWGPLQIRLREGDLAIGGVGCKGAPDEARRVEIGYGLAESVRGRGFATEALLGLIDWLRDQGVREVLAECDPGNAASIAVLRRCGFAPPGDDGLWCRSLSPAEG
jgi:ribosomal-protein-alanine N-acetyltransferase